MGMAMDVSFAVGYFINEGSRWLHLKFEMEWKWMILVGTAMYYSSFPLFNLSLLYYNPVSYGATFFGERV